MRDGQVAGQSALWTKPIGHAAVGEVVRADGNRHVGGNRERPLQQVIGVGKEDVEPVAVLQLDLEAADSFAGLDGSSRVGDEVEGPLP